MNTLKVEIETVKGRKMSFSHTYHNPHRFFGTMAVTTILDFEPRRIENMF